MDNDFIISSILIPGVLKLSSKSFKTLSPSKSNSKGYIMKEFESLFNIFPKFMVKTNKLKDYVDKYVIINVHKNDSTNGETIYGTVEKYIGDVGDIQTETLLCQYISVCNWSRKIDNLFKSSIIPVNIGISDNDLTPIRVDLSVINDNYVVSIDPDGCQDIDDAISVCQKTPTITTIGIHIADPSSYVIEFSDLDKEISKRIESVYLENTTYHMFPTILSTDVFSLKKNKLSRTFSVEIDIQKTENEWKIMNTQINKCLIKIHDNVTYDEFQQKINIHEQSKKIYEIGEYFYRKFLDPENVTNYDSKKMVEIFMVLANSIVAEKMIQLKNNNTPIILRSQKISDYKFDKTLAISENLINEHLKLKNKKAQLVLYDQKEISQESYFHAGLGLNLYTHFTSPIRRYSDILVHRILYNLITKTETFKITLGDNITKQIDIMNFYKKYYRNISQLEEDIMLSHQIIKTIGESPLDRIIYLEGMILDISEIDTSNRHALHDKKIVLRVKCKNIIDDIEMESIKDKIISKIHTINVTTDIENREFKLFEMINYKMCFLKNDIRKIRTYL